MEEKPVRNASRSDAGGKNKIEKISQLRQDLVTGDWVVIALGRGKRPGEFAKKRQAYAALTTNAPKLPSTDLLGLTLGNNAFLPKKLPMV